MNAPSIPNENPLPTPAASRPLRLKFPVALAVVFWAIWLINGQIEKSYFVSFMTEVGSSALFALLFFGWWWCNRGLRFKQKALGFALMVVGAFVFGKLRHPSLNPFLLFTPGIPLVAAVALAMLLRARRNNQPFVAAPFAMAVLAVWSLFTMIRMDGADSALKNALHLRWTPSSEERFLAEARPQKSAPTVPREDGPSEKDWTEFRGLHRDGIVRGSTISTNWTSNPPTLVWKHAVGPAWSTLITVGQKLFTQEQRGASEVVVCYDANSGEEIWAHIDAVRFEEPLSGIGPRATPTYEKGRLYTFGASGILNCIDAVTGKNVWKKDVAKDSEFAVAMWGFSSSPLVIDGKVIIYAGGPKGILAYRADTGELAWTAPGGEMSYSSAQGQTIDGVLQCLMLYDAGLVSLNPADGKQLWEAGLAGKGPPRCTQPRLIGANQLLVGALHGPGVSLIQLAKNGAAWTVSTNWISRDLKPEFPDFVVHNNYAYGFDASIFCCVNLADGKRAWKDGRYGMGQVALLAEQNVLLVASEKGELILLAADPSANKELGRFQAITGKTWNSAVVRGDLIFHRNAQEMACYRAAAPAKVARAKNF